MKYSFIFTPLNDGSINEETIWNADCDADALKAAKTLLDCKALGWNVAIYRHDLNFIVAYHS